MSLKKPVIFLVNQISGHGHLDSYARLYGECLIALGYRVVLIAGHEGGAPAWLAARGWNVAADFAFLARDELAPPPAPAAAASGASAEAAGPAAPPLAQRMRRVWQAEGLPGLFMRLYHYGRWALETVYFGTEKSFFRAIRWRPAPRRVAPGVPFPPIVAEIDAARRRLGVDPALVLFLYLDMMSEDRRGCRLLGRRLDLPWAGILFHPRHAEGRDASAPERYFRCRNARGALFLVPDKVEIYARRFPRLAFGLVPDVSDATTLPAGSALVETLRRRAAGRTIVLQAGSLGAHKGTLPLLDAIRIADPRRFFFAIVGEVFWEAFGPDADALRRFVDDPPENCLVRIGYLDDERELNALIAAADVLYAVYPDFRDSSNTLTKAALFEKPVLVNDRHLMGARVRAYGIGDTTAGGEAPAIVAGLERLRAAPPASFGFAAYRRDHSTDRLKDVLAPLLRAWIEGSGRR